MRTIQFKIQFPAEADLIYNMLMDQELHAQITGAEVRISNTTDGRFQLWGGYCHGYNIELKPGEKIIQAWHFDEDNWPVNHYSICSFVFEKMNGSCVLHFMQEDVPDSSFETLQKGWKEYYWDKMLDLLKAENTA